jgi:hypothetical protein
MNTTEQKSKWFNKSWLLLLLIFLFFPAAIYGLIKSELGRNTKIALWVAMLGLLAVVSQLGDTSPDKSPESIQTTENASSDQALTEIRKEPKVKEAIITDANVLYVSVEDDGTKRDGYAEYLCQILKEHKSNINWVKITKVGSTKDPNRDNAYGVLLGEAHCQ